MRIIPTKFGQNPDSSPLKQLLTTHDGRHKTTNGHKSSP